MERIPEFIGNHLFLSIAAGVIVLLVIANEARRFFRSYKEVSPSEAVRLLNNGAVAIDIRSTDAYRKAHLPEARHVPSDEIADSQAKLLKDKKSLLVYCDAGFTSAKAAATLASGAKENNVDTQIYLLKGGISAWQRDNFPLVK